MFFVYSPHFYRIFADFSYLFMCSLNNFLRKILLTVSVIDAVCLLLTSER